MIISSMAWLEYRGRPATTRTRLVQALVLSDLVLGYVVYFQSDLASTGNLASVNQSRES